MIRLNGLTNEMNEVRMCEKMTGLLYHLNDMLVINYKDIPAN